MSAKVTPEFKKAYERLNPQQKKAVDIIEGPVMVIAGPGTGKTQILTLRIANILRLTDTPPDAILALTFTESAAANMKRRLVSLVGPVAYKVHIHTFHGFANSIIQDNPDAFERFVGATALSDIEKLLLVVDILDEKREMFSSLTPFYDRHVYAKDIVSAISNLKRDAVLPDELFDFVELEEKNFSSREDIYNKKTGALKREFASYKAKLERSKELALLYKEYEKALEEKRRYDFEDMILELIKALRQDSEFKLQIQEEFLYVLADEHQDANDAQNALLELLTDFHDSPNLFIVGDEKQAIYRFQGASLQNFLYFKDKFKDVTLIELKDSYRSGQRILDVAHSVMASSKSGVKRVRLKSKAGIDNAKVYLTAYSSDEFEAALVAKKVKSLIDEGVDPGEIALIYRTNADADIFASSLSKEGVPFNIESDTNALEDLHIKKLLNLLDLVANFGDDEKLAEAMHLDFIGLDELDIYKLIKAYRKNPDKSLHEVLLDNKVLSSLNLSNQKSIEVFIKRVKKFAKRAKQDPISEIIPGLMEEFGFLSYILATPSSLDILEKLRALLKDAELVQQGKDNYFLGDFLDHIKLLKRHGLSISKQGGTKSGKRVRLYTAHKAKGLEFEYVFLLRAYDGKWGSRRNMEKFVLPVKSPSKDEEDEDERRLFFVALTRAKLAVYISYAKRSESGKERLPSKFISEIDAKLIETLEAKEQEEELAPEFFVKSGKNSKSVFDLDFLRTLLVEHGISVTALNNFLKCPWNYFYSNLVRIPKMQTKYMILGNALHFALQVLHEDANKGSVKEKEDYKKLMQEFIRSKAGSDIVFEDTLKLANEYFDDWFSTYKNELGKYRTLNEYRIDTELNIDFDELPKVRLTGILDRVDILDGNVVRVTDYKTGKVQSRNRILGKTKSEDSGDYYRQLLFYKLLLELEAKYYMKEGVIDFLQKKDNGQMVRESFDMTDAPLDELKHLIEQLVKSVWNLEFWDKRCEAYKKGKCKYCELRDLTS